MNIIDYDLSYKMSRERIRRYLSNPPHEYRPYVSFHRQLLTVLITFATILQS